LITFSGIDPIASLGRETQHLAAIDSNHDVDRCGVRLRHAPESVFGEFNDPIFKQEEIQAGVEDKPIDRGRNQG
jgi:hypothetical protein